MLFKLLAAQQLLRQLWQRGENGRLQAGVELLPALVGLQGRQTLGVVGVEGQLQWPLHRDAAIAKGRGREDLGDVAGFITAVEGNNLVDGLIA